MFDGNTYQIKSHTVRDAAEEAVRAELAALAETALGDASWFMREHDRKLLALAEDIRDDGRTDYTRAAEDYTLGELARVKELVLAAVSNAAAGQWELKQTEWALAERAFSTQYADWTAQINIVLGKSAAEWQKAEETLNAGYNEWRRNFERTYAERTGEWLESYEGFLEDKDAWMREQYLYAANYANYGIMEQSGMDAGAAVAEALKNMENAARPLEEQGFDTEKYIEQLVGDTGIAALMAYAGDLNGKAAGAAGVVRRGTALAAGSASDYAKAEAVVAEIGKERRVTAAKLAAEQARLQLAAARKSYAERLVAENKGMRDWEISMVRQNGYTVGSDISRSVVTDSLLFENKHSTQTVHIYEDFVTAEAVIATTLDDENLEGLDDYGIMMMLAQAQKELADWGEGIFGRVDDRGGQVQIRIARNSAEAARDAAKADLESGDRTLAFQRDGKLGEHIGYAPVFRDGGDLDLAESRSRNVRYTGAGEMGRIMLDFQWNDMMRGKGYGEMAAAVWDKRMWDDDGSWLKAPTLRTVTDIAVSVAFGPAGGLLDDAVFALLDGAGGYKGWDEIGVGFGKKVLTTAVTAGIGGAFGGMNAAIDKMTAGIDKTIAEVAGGFMQGTVTNLAASAIGSISYSDGSFGFDTKGFGQSVHAGLVGSLVQGVQTAASGLINIGIEGLIGNALGDTSKMSNFFGGLAGQGVNAALGGDFTLNVLNLGFLAGDGNTALDRILSTGLLEMHLGGESGFGMNIGTGGMDASIGNLMAVGRGIGTYIDVNSRLANTQQEATREFASAMRTWYSGTEEQRQSFDDALTNRLLLVKGTEKNFVEENDPSKTTYAQTKDNEDGTRTMTIGTAALGLDSRFGLNVVFGHEAYRDGIDNGEEGQRLETDWAVEGHVDTALALMKGYGNASVGFEFMAEAKIFDLARTNNDTATMRKILDRYDSSADYWKVIVKNDGTYKMEDDGSDDITLVDEKGKQLAFFEYQGGSRTGFIAETLGLDKKTVNNLMASSGWTYYTEKGWSSSLSGDAAAIRFGTDLSKQISFPVSAEQLLMFKDIIGTVYEKDGQQNTFNYDGVRISYAPVTEEVLRNEVNKLLKDKSDPAGIARLQKLDPNATLDQIVEGMIGTQIADQKKGDLALSLPNDRIYIPPQQYSTSLLVHEMFHQFQYAMNDNGDGFARLVSDMVTKASGKNSSINSGLPVGYVYDYSHYNTGTVNTLSDITTYEGQADVFFDFAGGYLGGVSNNTRVGHGYTVTKLAQIIYNSGFNSPAARKVLGIP